MRRIVRGGGWEEGKEMEREGSGKGGERRAEGREKQQRPGQRQPPRQGVVIPEASAPATDISLSPRPPLLSEFKATPFSLPVNSASWVILWIINSDGTGPRIGRTGDFADRSRWK